MSDPTANAGPPQSGSAAGWHYIVVARRYRPQTFDELVGQEHVAQALGNAISSNRVGHAYIFTGARGVGKTSAARILAKALNCQQGPAPVPCNRCDICQSISSGDDVDVLEIDGASNRGIDEVRQLRQNVNIRPGRARFKIYIIDEVHMLTREAFNALLKTLEEPPEHVKFIFCTTEPTKIPVTILSRCQRFDFAGISTASIARRLRQIVDAEGVEAEPEALEVLARRSAGSMRDSQSLLEQLLAFSSGRITLDDVHGMLGTGDERLATLMGHVVGHNAAAALAELDAALGEGVDAAQLLEQLLGYLRDCMAAAAGCPAESLLYTSAAGRPEVAEAGKRLGLTTVLAAMQILDQTLNRLRYSTQGRILAELALARLCQLEELDELPALIAQLQSGSPGPAAGSPGPAAGSPGPAVGSPRPAAGMVQSASSDPGSASAAKKKPEPVVDPPLRASRTVPAEHPAVELTAENAAEMWSRALGKLSGLAVEQARLFDRIAVSAPNRLVISFKPGYALAKAICEQPGESSRFENALSEVAGRPIGVEFRVEEEPGGTEVAPPPTRPPSQQQRLKEIAQHPMIHRATELFGAQPIRVDDPPDKA
jgi:DNA polymerase-3 subunit gamma/tau